MSKLVIHIFHADESSLGAGSHVAERIRQVMQERGVALGAAEAFAQRGLRLAYARDKFVEYALEGASVISF